jgi:prepilin peptidase CpaA
VVSGAFLVCAPIERLPTFGWVAAFLFFAMESDLRSLRIPNRLNLAFGAAALALALHWGGLEAGAWALLAAGITFALLFPAFALGALGAGDVKALMVLSAFLGAGELPGLLWWSVVCGGIAGLAWITLRGGLLDLAKRWTRTLSIFVASRRIVYVPPAEASAAAQGIPFALAIGVGATALQLWGTPWA